MLARYFPKRLQTWTVFSSPVSRNHHRPSFKHVRSLPIGFLNFKESAPFIWMEIWTVSSTIILPHSARHSAFAIFVQTSVWIFRSALLRRYHRLYPVLFSIPLVSWSSVRWVSVRDYRCNLRSDFPILIFFKHETNSVGKFSNHFRSELWNVYEF